MPLNPQASISDEVLLAQSLDGQPEAFSQLVARYERRIYGLVWKLCGRPSAIDDLYQQVWLKAWAGRASFQGKSRFGTWLYSIALNEVRNWRRGLKDQVPLDQVPEPSSRGPSVLDRLLGRARNEAIQKAMLGMDPKDQESLHLRFQQDMDYSEIARLTHSSLAQARLRNFRALRRLKDRLKDQDL